MAEPSLSGLPGSGSDPDSSSYPGILTPGGISPALVPSVPVRAPLILTVSAWLEIKVQGRNEVVLGSMAAGEQAEAAPLGRLTT